MCDFFFRSSPDPGHGRGPEGGKNYTWRLLKERKFKQEGSAVSVSFLTIALSHIAEKKD